MGQRREEQDATRVLYRSWSRTHFGRWAHGTVVAEKKRAYLVSWCSICGMRWIAKRRVARTWHAEETRSANSAL